MHLIGQDNRAMCKTCFVMENVARHWPPTKHEHQISSQYWINIGVVHCTHKLGHQASSKARGSVFDRCHTRLKRLVHWSGAEMSLARGTTQLALTRPNTEPLRRGNCFLRHVYWGTLPHIGICLEWGRINWWCTLINWCGTHTLVDFFSLKSPIEAGMSKPRSLSAPTGLLNTYFSLLLFLFGEISQVGSSLVSLFPLNILLPWVI